MKTFRYEIVFEVKIPGEDGECRFTVNMTRSSMQDVTDSLYKMKVLFPEFTSLFITKLDDGNSVE